ncbi:Uncharacterised protein [uncultured Clostridium sp.]|nr:Uncharacterised protein [uncultured Clostridium sp.]
MLCIGSAVVVEQFVVRSDLLVYLVHVFLYDGRHSVIVFVTCFSCLEEDVRVLSGAAQHRMFRIQRTGTVCINRIHVHHFLQIFIIPHLNLLDLMRSSETVKEMNKGNPAFNRSQMSNSAQVHNFLNGAGAKHRETGLTACINVRMVAEDR